MKKWVLIFGGLLLFSVAAKAQDMPKVEVFGGYSFLRVSDGGSSANANGGSASLAYNVTRSLGIVADFGGYHGDNTLGDANVYSYLFGPKFAYRSGRITPFVQALFGAAHVSVGGFGGSASENAFATALGGGVDWNATSHLGVRLIQAEYLLTKFNDGGNNQQNSARVSAGIVFRF